MGKEAGAMSFPLCRKHGIEPEIGFLMFVPNSDLNDLKLLDNVNTNHFAHPEPTQVGIGAKPGKALLVSGHDLKDLETILKQTENKGINVYTHGEMLPGHAYPELKKHTHLAGHFGTAWQNQGREFQDFPGPVLFTTNCIQKPQDSYKDNIFTTGVVGWPGIFHVKNNDYTQVIDKALETPGFTAEKQTGTTLVGYARNTILQKHPIVGGFLGAGKTTLLEASARQLSKDGLNIGLITNDQAPQLVDTAFLSRNDQKVEEVSGSCFCCNLGGLMDAVDHFRLKENADVILADQLGAVLIFQQPSSSRSRRG